MFSLSTYLNWLDYDFEADDEEYKHWYTAVANFPSLPEKFLHYLDRKVSNSCHQPKFQFQLLIIQGKSDLYHHHLLCYMKHLNIYSNNPPTREKFRLMSTVWFVFQKSSTSQWRGTEAASWSGLCAKLFGFNEEEISFDLDATGYRLLREPTAYEGARDDLDETMNGLLDERLIPEPVLAHRVACIALSCMQYLHRQDSNNFPVQDNLLAAWAVKSKRLPWLWRQRMRVTLIGRRQPTLDYDGPKYPFPQSLRRSYQMLYSEGIQSEDFYQKRHIFYMWTLDLLYHTLRTAMKSDELTKALSKPFIPSAACIFFPRRIKQVQKAVSAYLEKVSWRACSDLRTPTDIYLHVDSSIRRV